MVKIVPFSSSFPFSPEEFVIPQVNQHHGLFDNYIAFDEKQPSLTIRYNKSPPNHHAKFNQALELDGTFKYESLQKYWRQYEALGLFKKCETKNYYVYRLQYKCNGSIRSQTGLICCIHLDSQILGHEKTLKEKVMSQFERIYESKASISPIYLMQKDELALEQIMAEISEKTFPIIDFVSTKKVRHTLWRCLSQEKQDQLTKSVNSIATLYVADGHHRLESAKQLRKTLKAENPNHTEDELYNYILSAIFPISQLRILEYNRIAKNVRKFDSIFLPNLKSYFSITKLEKFERPSRPGQITMYKDDKWYSIIAKPIINNPESRSVKKRLDTYIIQKYVFEKILGIKNIRTSKKIIYISGDKPLSAIQNTADLHNGVAFFLYPIAITDVIEIAEQGQTVPPKSTWFDPKLLKGMLFWSIK